MSDTPATPTSDYEALARELQDKSDDENDPVAAAISDMAETIKQYEQMVSDLQAERDALAAFKAGAKEKTKAAGRKVAEWISLAIRFLPDADYVDDVTPGALAAHIEGLTLRAEYKPSEATLQASLETALANLKRAEDANRLAGKNEESLFKRIEELNAEKAATDAEYLRLHKELEALRAAKRDQDRAIQTFVGAASRPTTGPCTLNLKAKPAPNGDGPVSFTIEDGQVLFGWDIVDGKAYVGYITRATAAEQPVPTEAPEADPVPEHKPNETEATPRAA